MSYIPATTIKEKCKSTPNDIIINMMAADNRLT